MKHSRALLVEHFEKFAGMILATTWQACPKFPCGYLGHRKSADQTNRDAHHLIARLRATS